MARVLIVDDEPWILRALGRELRRLGHEVVAATGTEDAVADRGRFDAAILDLELGGETGVDCARRLGRQAGPGRVLFHSGTSDRALLGRAASFGRVVAKGDLDAVRQFVATASGA